MDPSQVCGFTSLSMILRLLGLMLEAKFEVERRRLDVKKAELELDEAVNDLMDRVDAETWVRQRALNTLRMERLLQCRQGTPGVPQVRPPPPPPPTVVAASSAPTELGMRTCHEYEACPVLPEARAKAEPDKAVVALPVTPAQTTAVFPGLVEAIEEAKAQDE